MEDNFFFKYKIMCSYFFRKIYDQFLTKKLKKINIRSSWKNLKNLCNRAAVVEGDESGWKKRRKMKELGFRWVYLLKM